MSTSRRRVQFPVTAYTYRILQARYGLPVIATRSCHKELWELLQLAPIAKLTSERRKLLTHSIELELSGMLATALRKRDAAAVSIALHNHFIRQMYVHTHSRVTGGQSAWDSIEDWYELRDIQDEDWLFDTAHRNWLRYQEAFEKRSKTIKKVVNRRASQPVIDRVHILISELSEHKIKPEQVRKLLFEQLRFPQRDRQAIYIWLLRRLCRLSAAKVAIRLGCSVRNAFARQSGMEERLRKPTPQATRMLKALTQLLEDQGQLAKGEKLFSP